MNIIAIIPARSGSKGLPDKNIKKLCGKPLMAFSIEAAIKANVFDEIMVSTDSEIYADIACKYGANVPFLRSYSNSTDEASTWDTVLEVINQYNALGRYFDSFMVLQPTSPLRNEKDIIGAMEEFRKKDANSIVSVCECEHSPIYANTLPATLSMDTFFGDHKWTRRQDLPTYYRLNGAIYMSKVSFFTEYKDIYREKCFAYIMDRLRSVDIDSEMDFLYAEQLINHYGGCL